MSAHKNKRSAHHKQIGKYANTAERTAKNKARKLAKHIKMHPNDKQAKEI